MRNTSSPHALGLALSAAPGRCASFVLRRFDAEKPTPFVGPVTKWNGRTRIFSCTSTRKIRQRTSRIGRLKWEMSWRSSAGLERDAIKIGDAHYRGWLSGA